ncbi:MAG TPA: sugar dehydrogenase complex small subunit [Herbaspirillum sp.]|nr:sugar dehydrogenase complex small subunit [Herbaspirillum sp.]
MKPNQYGNNRALIANRPRLFLGRRRWLQRALALIAAGSGASMLLKAQGAESSAPLATFMTLSQALTSKAVLNPAVGARLLDALQKNTPDFPQRMQQLAAALLAGWPQAPAQTAQQALALRIMQGWYLGVVDNTVITYEEALMFEAVSDTLPIRSYCFGKPGFWAEKPIEKLIGKSTKRAI